MYVALNNEEEAYFLCSILNSSIAQLIIVAYMVLHPDAHVSKNVKIPKYARSNPIHQRLAELSIKAHQTKLLQEHVNIENEIDKLTAEIWKIGDDELEEIKHSLRIVSPTRV